MMLIPVLFWAIFPAAALTGRLSEALDISPILAGGYLYILSALILFSVLKNFVFFRLAFQACCTAFFVSLLREALEKQSQNALTLWMILIPSAAAIFFLHSLIFVWLGGAVPLSALRRKSRH